MWSFLCVCAGLHCNYVAILTSGVGGNIIATFPSFCDIYQFVNPTFSYYVKPLLLS